MKGNRGFDNGAVAENSTGDAMDVGTPGAGTTQAAGSSIDSSNYSTYEEIPNPAVYDRIIAVVKHPNSYYD